MKHRLLTHLCDEYLELSKLTIHVHASTKEHDVFVSQIKNRTRVEIIAFERIVPKVWYAYTWTWLALYMLEYSQTTIFLDAVSESKKTSICRQQVRNVIYPHVFTLLNLFILSTLRFLQCSSDQHFKGSRVPAIWCKLSYFKSFIVF